MCEKRRLKNVNKASPLQNKGIFAPKINNYLMFVEVCTSGPDPGLSVLAGGGRGLKLSGPLVDLGQSPGAGFRG